MISPVLITFEMRTPVVVPGTSKPLDAVLSWAAVQRSDFQEASDPIADQHHIGLARHSVGDSWCFMASELSYVWLDKAPSQVHYIKRQNIESYSEAWIDGLLTKRPAFNAQSGHTKAGSYVASTRWASSISAYAVVEDMQRLMQLLPWVTHIGKLHHKDFGAVRGFTVQENADAEKLWCQRALPVGSSFATSHVPGIGGLVSPYWKRENHLEILLPKRAFS
jgi:CRISPR type IV-associated protein Csf3